MWKGKKKFIIIGLLAVVVLAGSIAGVAFAQTATRTTPGKALLADTTSGNITLMDRVAAILKIDPQTLKNAFTQAQKEQQDQALTDFLNKAVAQGKMTRPQADQYKQWWQSRPNVPLPGGSQPFGMHRSPGGRRGMMGGWGRNFKAAPAPVTPTQPQ